MMSLLGFIFKEYANAFNNWAITVKESVTSINAVEKDVELLRNFVEMIRKKMEAGFPPEPTRERIEAIEDFLRTQGYKPPNNRW
jgi:hypothetical protein